MIQVGAPAPGRADSRPTVSAGVRETPAPIRRTRTQAAAVPGVGQNTPVDVHAVVSSGSLAAPGDWLSEAPHLVGAVLDDRVRITGIPRHKGVIAAVRAIDEASLQRRRKLWRTIRQGLGLYDPETLRDEAIRVGLLTTVPRRSALAEPELEGAVQLTLFAAGGDEPSDVR